MEHLLATTFNTIRNLGGWELETCNTSKFNFYTVDDNSFSQSHKHNLLPRWVRKFSV